MLVPRKVSKASLGVCLDWLALDVEAFVQEHLAAGGFAHGFEQSVKFALVVARDNRHASRAVAPGGVGNRRPLHRRPRPVAI